MLDSDAKLLLVVVYDDIDENNKVSYLCIVDDKNEKFIRLF